MSENRENPLIRLTALEDVTVGGNLTIGSINQNVIYQTPKPNQPIPSDVRQGSPNFVGREKDLEDLDRALQREGIVAVCAVRGMGGVGKTELALQYANSKQGLERFAGCYLFSLNEGSLASLVLQKTAPYLVMPEEIEKSSDIYEQVKWCWQNWHPDQGEILIILDDVKNLDDIPKKAMPIDRRFKVMLTTRTKNLSPSFQELQLGVLSEGESLQLLRNIVDRDGTSRIDNELDTAKEICAFVGYLPLALELIATYLVEDEMLTLGEYRQRLTIQDRSLSDEMVKWITAERGVIAAFGLSWQRLVGLSPDLAKLLGRFGPAEIPWQLLVEPTVKDLGWNEDAVKKGRVQLANLHLISIREQKNIGIHSLLREYFRYWADKTGDEYIHRLQRSLAKTGIEVSKTIPETPVREDIDRVKDAIPHLEVLSRELLADIPDPEEDLIWAFAGVAFYYRGQGAYALALPHLEACLNATEERFGEGHPSNAASLNNLAALYRGMGRYEEALLLYERSLSISEQQLGANHPATATSINNLGLLYSSIGRYEEALSLYEQSLSIREEQLGANHPDTATSINNLAALYSSMGKYEEALPLYERSLLISEEQLGANHPTTATSLNNLAALYSSMGKYEDSLPLHQRSLSIREEQLGNHHPATATSRNNLAGLYSSMGKYEDSLPLHQRSLSIREEQLGNHHPDTAKSLGNLAELYRTMGRYEDALPLYERSLSIFEEQLGANHPDTATSLNNLGLLYHLMGRYEESLPLYERSLSISERVFGRYHPQTLTCRNNLRILRLRELTWWQWLLLVLLLPVWLPIGFLAWLVKQLQR